MIKRIYNQALTEGAAYQWLDFLCHNIGHRLSGTPQAAASVEWTRQVMDTLGLDSVWLQPLMVPRWIRGDKEIARMVTNLQTGDPELSICALGNSLGTGPEGLTAQVVEVHSYEEMAAMAKGSLKGKIVFYNVPMDPTNYSTFRSYGQ